MGKSPPSKPPGATSGERRQLALGLPWLKTRQRTAVETVNAELRATLKVLQTARETSSSVILSLFHPEDRGKAECGRPASPWQLSELREWPRRNGLHRAAFWMCAFGRTVWPQPTGCLTSHPVKLRGLHRGWPVCRSTHNEVYLGPLTQTCHCGQAHGPNGQAPRGEKIPVLSENFVQKWLQTTLHSCGRSLPGDVEQGFSLKRQELRLQYMVRRPLRF